MSDQQTYITLLADDDGVSRIMNCGSSDHSGRLIKFILSDDFQESMAKSLAKFLSDNYPAIYAEFEDRLNFIIDKKTPYHDVIVRPSKYSSGEY